MGLRWSDGYSSRVKIYLDVEGQKLSVAQVGPDSLILREPKEIPPSSTGLLIIDVDGKQEEEQILLPNGASKDKELVKFF